MWHKKTFIYITASCTDTLRLVVILSVLWLMQCDAKDTPCSIKPYRMELKREVMPFKNDLKTLSCVGNVTLASCEGLCMSEVTPSVLAYAGMDKKCHCCRETKMKERQVYLSECHSMNGAFLPGVGHSVIVREPMHCKCQPCTG